MKLFKKIGFRSLILLFFHLLALLGCATLPKIEDVFERLPPSEPPKVIGPHGELSPKMSKGVLERLKKQTGPNNFLDREVALIEAISGNPLVTGNKVTLLTDGPATYAAMQQTIRGAKDHIHFETYIFEDDEVGRQFADLLVKKQSEGVQVNLIYDSVGCSNTPAAFFQRLDGMED